MYIQAVNPILDIWWAVIYHICGIFQIIVCIVNVQNIFKKSIIQLPIIYSSKAACQKFSLFLVFSSSNISSLVSSTSRSNNATVVMHGQYVLVQHLFSSGVGNGLQQPHLHHSGMSSGYGCRSAPGIFPLFQ